jgi:hypothetical protein
MCTVISCDLPAGYVIVFLKNLALRAICRCGLSDTFFAIFFNEQISRQLHTHYLALQLFYFKYSTAFSLKSTELQAAHDHSFI